MTDRRETKIPQAKMEDMDGQPLSEVSCQACHGAGEDSVQRPLPTLV